MSRTTLQALLASGLLTLTALSLWVFSGAVDEPFVFFRAREALVQVGMGVTLLVLWIQFSIFLSWAALTRRVSRWWLLFLIWCAAGFMVVEPSPFGYVQDITKFAIERR